MSLSLAWCCIENVPLLLKLFCFGLKKVTADYFQWFLHLVMLKKLVQDFAVFQWPHTSYVIMTIKWEHMVQQYLTVPEAFWAVISQHGFHTLLVIQTVFQCWISIQVLWQRDQLVCVAYFMRNVFFSSFYLVCYFWNCIKTLWKFYGLMLGLLYGLYTYFYFHVCKWWEDFIVWWPMHSWTRLLVRDQLRPSVAAQLAAVLQERILELSKAVKMMEVEGLSLSSKFCV